MMWRKIHVWVEETRVDQSNLRFEEWVQWLVERVEECEADMEPAYVKYKDWKN